jgi:hypothetical protein
MTAEIWVIFMLSLPQMLCMFPMYVNTTFNCCFCKCVLKKIPDFMWICQQACSIHCCNTSNSLIRSEYTKGIWCRHIVRQHLNQAFGQTVDRMWRPSQVACKIPWPSSAEFLAAHRVKWNYCKWWILMYKVLSEDLFYETKKTKETFSQDSH